MSKFTRFNIQQYYAALIAVVLTILGGCATMEESVKRDVQTMRAGPQEKPIRNVTGFSDGLRCMDNLFLVHNVRDFVVLIEELTDRTGQVNAGTRDMVISAVSDMTRRSNAIELITYSLQDSSNLVGFLERGGKIGPYETVPPFDLRGSISQLDRGLVTKRINAGVKFSSAPDPLAVDPTVSSNPASGGTGISGENSGTVLGLDLSVITTHNMAVIPGVTTHNSVAIYQSTRTADANASINKIGVNFNISSNRSEGVAQALRALVEMSTIELFGKLAKVPYWKCLGIPADSDEITKEISDWYFSMSKHGTLTKYLKTLLQAQGQYSGALDNNPDPVFVHALNTYKKNKHLRAGPEVGLEAFAALLDSTPTRAQMPGARYARTAAEPAPAPLPAAPKPANLLQAVNDTPRLFVEAINAKQSYAPGEEVLLRVTSSDHGFLYCYLLDAEQKIARFYPNRFAPDNFLPGPTSVQLPGDMPFTINANENGKTESVLCYLTSENVYSQLPPSLRQPDFKPLTVRSQTELAAAFAGISKRPVAQGSFAIKVH